MDYYARLQYEAVLEREVGAILRAETPELVRLVQSLDSAHLAETWLGAVSGRLRAVLETRLREIFAEAGRDLGRAARVDVGAHVDWGMANERAAAWARSYSYDLVRGVTATMQRDLARFVSDYYAVRGMTIGDLTARIQSSLVREIAAGRMSLEDAIGRVWRPETRAANIAVTEVTRASVGGELAIVAQIRAEDRSIREVPIWNTNRDEWVCRRTLSGGRPSCAARHGQARGAGTWMDYPPAHTKCRCNVRHEFIRAGGRALGQAAAAQAAGTTP